MASFLHWGAGGVEFSLLTLQPPSIHVTNIDRGPTMMVSTVQGLDTLVNQILPSWSLLSMAGGEDI